MHTDTVNRKWLNKTYRTASRGGRYFKGANTREVAHSIVATFDMHPCFVGKLDQMLAKLIADGGYKLSEGQLIRCDKRPKAETAGRRLRKIHRRAAKRGKQQYRDFAIKLQADTQVEAFIA